MSKSNNTDTIPTVTLVTSVVPTITAISTRPSGMKKCRKFKVPAGGYQINALVNAYRAQTVFFKFEGKSQTDFGYTATGSEGASQMLGVLEPMSFNSTKEDHVHVYLGTQPTAGSAWQDMDTFAKMERFKNPSGTLYQNIFISGEDDPTNQGAVDNIDAVVTISRLAKPT